MSLAANNHAATSRGFTLVEMVVALAIMSILLVGAGSAVLMTVSAADTNNDANTRFTESADVMDRMLADVQSATSVDERTSSAITVTVPDRNADGRSEQIRYAWTGSYGGVLTRAVNGAAPSTVLRYVNDFRITPMLRSGKATTQSAEQRLIGCEDCTGGALHTAAVTAASPVAQYIKPAFDSNVAGWNITRVRLYLMRDATPTGTLRVSLVLANNWQPTGATLVSSDIPEATLPAAITSFDLALPSGSIPPRQGVYLKLESVGAAGAAATIQACRGSATLPYNTYFTSSADSGATWSAPQDTTDLSFVAFGTITTGN